ncbi:hypothetical protein [Crassaminicella indica]|uniref:Uncharacterized protein n=1 Tax=Crassaminicella indica TaxID=2855394 RepID=A0ABX8RJT4_9CLOT|nr:hypothetical protein [Crassaminicella indica]QXM07161.1 hypothetical protein KVH43_05535 [Crassaminicella indica]
MAKSYMLMDIRNAIWDHMRDRRNSFYNLPEDHKIKILFEILRIYGKRYTSLSWKIALPYDHK